MIDPEIAERARAAQELLDHPTFAALLSDMRADLVTEWRNSAPGSGGLREAVYNTNRALDALEAVLVARVDAAKFAQAQADKAERRDNVRTGLWNTARRN